MAKFLRAFALATVAWAQDEVDATVDDTLYFKPLCENVAEYDTPKPGHHGHKRALRARLLGGKKGGKHGHHPKHCPKHGARMVRLPAAACAQTVGWENSEILNKIHALCCANTHVRCEEGREVPELMSYDGQITELTLTESAGTDAQDAVAWLSKAHSDVCAMPMAVEHNDCATCTDEKKAKSTIETDGGLSEFFESKHCRHHKKHWHKWVIVAGAGVFMILLGALGYWCFVKRGRNNAAAQSQDFGSGQTGGPNTENETVELSEATAIEAPRAAL